MIVGAKVVLRAWESVDLPILQAMRNDFPLQQRLMSRPRSNSLDQVKEWLSNRTKSDNCLFFVIADKITFEAVGYVQVTHIDFISMIGNLGICVAPEHQGKGFGKEALMLLMDYAGDIFGLRKLMLEVLTTNGKAIGLYKKIGFSEVGRMRNHFYMNHTYHDVLLMEKHISL